MGDDDLVRIGEASKRTSVSESTLRMWERRYGFPAPRREAGGHRRYSESEIAMIEAAKRARDRGLPTRRAIEQALTLSRPAERTVFAALRRERPELRPEQFSKRGLGSLSEAVEDEYLAHAPEAVIFASFQRRRFFQQSKPRWVEICRYARRCVAFSDFPELVERSGGPIEVPMPRSSPQRREWALVFDATEFAAALAGWELPAQHAGERRFEVLWSIEPDVVRAASLSATEATRVSSPALADDLVAEITASPVGRPDVRELTSLTNRMLAYLHRT
jgi:DNA-binding transcriptional MerR regulator